MKIRKGDEVIVLTGKNKSKKGTVLRVLKDQNKLLVENVNMAKRHTKTLQELIRMIICCCRCMNSDIHTIHFFKT